MERIRSKKNLKWLVIIPLAMLCAAMLLVGECAPAAKLITSKPVSEAVVYETIADTSIPQANAATPILAQENESLSVVKLSAINVVTAAETIEPQQPAETEETKQPEVTLTERMLAWLAEQAKTIGTTVSNYFKSRAVGSTLDSTGPNFGEALVNPEMEAAISELKDVDYGWSIDKTSNQEFDLYAEVGTDLNTLEEGDTVSVMHTTTVDPTVTEEGVVEVEETAVKDTKNVVHNIVVMDTDTFTDETAGE